MSLKGENMTGKLIVFEGPEGSGKTTQAQKMLEFIRKNNKKVVLLREPGGTEISEKIRNIILDPKHDSMAAKAELLLYEAARAQIVEEKIKMFLNKGYYVLLDRFFLATVVYQGYGRGIDRKMIHMLNTFAADGLFPDATIVYDVTPKEAERRMQARGKKDRMELMEKKFHVRVRAGYLKEARKMKWCSVIDTNGKTLDEVFEETGKKLKRLL
jgi:dTMP kinase